MKPAYEIANELLKSNLILHATHFDHCHCNDDLVRALEAFSAQRSEDLIILRSYEAAYNAKTRTFKKCLEIAQKHVQVFGDLSYERAAKNIRNEIQLALEEPKQISPK